VRGRFVERLLGLVVAGDQDRRPIDLAEGVDDAVQSEAHRGEVAGADHDIGLVRALHEPRRLVAVTVQVAEGEQPHCGAEVSQPAA
jgi:hypothetical protein